MTQVIDNRRYDIDWLRTLAFGLLILYHVGMYYVADWGWHVKSEQQSVFLQNLMILTNQWRMSLLFFVSGIALALVYVKYSRMHLLKLRSKRLLIPLLFGMLVVVPPQLYFELLQGKHFAGSYLSFMHEYLNLNTALAPHKQTDIGLLTWNHLWFVPYLWVYSLIALLLMPMIKFFLSHTFVQKLPLWLGMALLVVSLVLIWLGMREQFPVTHALLDDWYNHAKYFLVFLAGIALAHLPSLWQRLIDKRRVFIVLAIFGCTWIVLDRQGMFDLSDELDQLFVIKFIHGVLLFTNHWAWIFALVAYAGRYLQFSNRFLNYANQAILPWYILHQTLIILLAMQLLSSNLPAYIEAPVLIFLTIICSVFGYEVIRRITLLRWLFGLKVGSQESANKVAKVVDLNRHSL